MHQDARTVPDPTGDHGGGASFRLAVVPGVNPAKWVRVWDERLPDVPLVLVAVPAAQAQDALRAGRADAALLRVPVDRSVLSAIELYTETSVVVVPTDHLVAAADEVAAADLADDVLLVPADDVLGWADPPGEASGIPAPPTTADAVELAAAGAGVLVVPQSLARLHHRRDLTYRPVTDAPTSSVGLAWVTDRESDLVEELIGIVRGRTVNSTRGRGAGAARPPPPAPTGSAEPTSRTARGSAGGRTAGTSRGAPQRSGRGRTSGRKGGPRRPHPR